MTYTVEALLEQLKQARQQKNMSQRELAEKSGIPQSHISRIEGGKVNLTASSLVDIARALEFEPMLIPRQMIPLVTHLLKVGSKDGREAPPAYQLDDEED